jgi:uncharacterized membrane protein
VPSQATPGVSVGGNTVIGYSNDTSSYSNDVGVYSNGGSNYSNGIGIYSNATSVYSNGAGNYSNGLFLPTQVSNEPSYASMLDGVPKDPAPSTQTASAPSTCYPNAPAVQNALATATTAATASNKAAGEATAAHAKAESQETKDKVYANTLNCLTSKQLEQEKRLIEQQIQKGGGDQQALQRKLALINAELKTRPESLGPRFADDLAREKIQNEYTYKSSEQLEADLQELFERGTGADLQKRIGAIQAELLKRGISPLTPERLVATQKAAAAKQAYEAYQTAVQNLRSAEAKEKQRLDDEAAAKAAAEAAAAEAAKWAMTDANFRNAIIVIYENYQLITGHQISKTNPNPPGFTRESLQAFLDNNQGIPAHVRDACQFLLKNSAAFDILDVAAYGHQPNHQKDRHVGGADMSTAYRKATTGQQLF